VHTGQHYDYAMSTIFFDELGIDSPDINLGVGSARHGAQTASMLVAIENVLLAQRPDWVLIYGDTNSTLAGALAASKLTIPIAHVEAGLRSFNRRMPEEINRVVADHLSSLLLCPSTAAATNLSDEGVTNGVHVVGDVMSDTLRWIRERMAEDACRVIDRFGLGDADFLVCTIHRAENTDDTGRLAAILNALGELREIVVLPLHPRTRNAFERCANDMPRNVRVVAPLGYGDMIGLTCKARMVLTDSGGLQKEAYWLGVPCVTLRDETEWIETVEAGWNILVGADSERIVNCVRTFSPPISRPSLYGDGAVAGRCVSLLESVERSATPMKCARTHAASLSEASMRSSHEG
jgi:UDP-N-acetylglucosamine 2-epimerase